MINLNCEWTPGLTCFPKNIISFMKARTESHLFLGRAGPAAQLTSSGIRWLCLSVLALFSGRLFLLVTR